MSGPLGATLAHLDSEDEYCRYRLGMPSDAGWFCLDSITSEEGWLDEWVRQINKSEGGPAAMTGSFLASWIAGMVVEPAARALLSQRRTWPLDPCRLFVHRHEDGWLDGLSVASPAVRMLQDDPQAGHPDAIVVEDEAALRRNFATEAVAVLTPLFGAVRARTPYGVRGMWGAVADSIAGGATWRARQHDEDGAAAFGRAMELVAILATQTSNLRVRPKLVPVEWSAGVHHFSCKGTCCLWYQSQESPDPSGEGYCSSCPKRSPESQAQRWARWLEEQAAEKAAVSQTSAS